MSNIGVAVVEIADANVHKLLYANKNYYMTRKYQPEEIQETYENNVVELLDSESRIRMNILIEEALRYKKNTLNFDIKVRCKDGCYRCLLCKGKLIYKPERVTMNIVETDITSVSDNLSAGIL
ncbi:PAS domain-containing protein [Aminipila terrae]|uniref:PAS domain-containing protein n=1 Tax=Aminipila terrae TaxID=2697030 RepID=A0A6P1MDS3_9FIRM|nr:PAS domain-containing protein [Aminipila terrae]QHI71981.1 PAS domain-containing protein [Aminipila terrae]